MVSGDGVILLLVHFGLPGLESTNKLIYSNLAYNLNNEHSLKVLTTEPSASLRVDCLLSLESLSSYSSTSVSLHFNKPRSYLLSWITKCFTPINLGDSQIVNTPIKVVFDLGVFVFSLVGRTKYYNNTNGETIDVKNKA